ncbi:MAG: NAD(P)H-dependent oxidoreductase subunit E [Pseudomonadales bacterium]
MHDQASIERTVAEFAESNPVTADQLLPFLHHVQQANGYIGADAVALIGKLLNLSRAEVFGVVSFYDDFHSEPQTTIVEICGAEACQALGCRSLLANAASSSTILTAAHCVYDDVHNAFARNVLFIPNQADTTGSATDLNCNNDPLGC